MVMFIVQLLHIRRFCQFKTALNSYFFLNHVTVELTLEKKVQVDNSSFH